MKRIAVTLLLGVLCALPGYAARSGIDPDPAADPHPNRSHLVDEALATPENPVPSPSGAYTLVIVPGFHDNVYDNRFEVYAQPALPEPVFRSPAFYRTRDRLYFAWDEEDNIWVYSGDIGTVFWQRDGETWSVQPHLAEDRPAILDRRG